MSEYQTVKTLIRLRATDFFARLGGGGGGGKITHGVKNGGSFSFLSQTYKIKPKRTGPPGRSIGKQTGPYFEIMGQGHGPTVNMEP